MKWRVLVVLMLAGCSRTTELLDDGTIPGLVAIELDSSASSIVVDELTVTHDVSFTATGVFESGERREVTGELSWLLSTRFQGDFISPGLWRSSNEAGGRVRVEARAGQVYARETIDVHFEPTLNDPSFPVAGDGAALFESPALSVVADPENSPAIVYPSNETAFPLDLEQTLFQFERAASTDAFMLRFRGAFLDLKVLTTNDRWQAEGTTFRYLSRTAAGDTVTMSVAGVDSTTPGTQWLSAPVELTFDNSAIGSSLLYWSGAADGILRTELSELTATGFYDDADFPVCVGCHSVSRDGTKMAVASEGERLETLALPTLETRISTDQGYRAGWSSFSPDGNTLVVAHNGTLSAYEAVSGYLISELDLGIDVTHPDWSPRGDFIAIAACGNADNDRDVDRCSIGRIPVDGSTFGELEILVPAASGADNNYFPRYSPTGDWIAFVNADGKSRTQKNATLRLVRATGGEPISLVIASSRVGSVDDVADTATTMPAWAPADGPGLNWLALSSGRDYGIVLTEGIESQIWVAGIDLQRAEEGRDPSFAAFRLPAQPIDERNHLPRWLVVSSCRVNVEVCDGYDNDCDGLIDEDCTECDMSEFCSDSTDNDCDGLVDNGCFD